MKLELSWIDYLIMIIYFLFVLGIGWFLRKFMKNANAFLEAGRSMPAWVAGLAFISTNLGALEVMGMTGSGMKYGMLDHSFLLDRRYSCNDLSCALYDAFLLWFKSQVGS